MQRKLLPERRWRALRSAQPFGQYHGRTLSARRYVELGRQPRLGDLPVRHPPYLEASATAAVFIFLLYLILGGA